VIGSKDETRIIFQKIINGGNVKVLSQIFEAEYGSFLELFRQASTSLSGANLAVILSRFNVASWTKSLQVGTEMFYPLYDALLEAVLAHREDEVGFSALVGFLESLIHNCPESSFNRLIVALFSVLQRDTMNPIIFR
jgi:hypothetical protein